MRILRGPVLSSILVVSATAALATALISRPTPEAGASQPPRNVPVVLLDGDLSDWDGVPDLLVDARDAAPASPVDVLSLRALDDPDWLYLLLALGGEVNLQAMRGTLHLVVDTDGDATTGGTALGMTGADMVLDLSPRGEGDGAQPYGAGFAVRGVVSAGPGTPRPAYDVGAAGLPTWAASRFEIRLSRRGADDGFGRLGDRVRLRLVAVSPEGHGDETVAATYAFVTPVGSAPTEADLAPLLTKAPGAVRVAQWNVSEGSFRNPERHARVLAAVRPDVVLLDEVYEEISDEALEAFFAHPDLAALGTWRWAYSGAGGRQKTVVAARDRNVRQEPSMHRVEYHEADLAALRRRIPDAAHRMVDLEARVHMSATGVWVDVDGTEVLFVPLDLQSAGYLGSPQDLLREVQAETLRRHVREALASPQALTGHPATQQASPGALAPVVVGGDFNPVGSRAPVDILASGLDTDGSDLALAAPRRLGEASLFTWTDPGHGPFAPGRLDLTLYADAALETTGGFVFNTGDLSDAQLARLGLDRHLSATTSDHLVVVTDLRLR